MKTKQVYFVYQFLDEIGTKQIIFGNYSNVKDTQFVLGQTN